MITAPILATLALTLAQPLPADIRIIDGDTIVAGGVHIRIENIDAPETARARCPAEHAAGLRAKAALASLLKIRPVMFVPSTDRDPYGRTLGHLIGPAGDLGTLMAATGNAIIWADGPKAKAARIAHWCGPMQPKGNSNE